MCVGMILRDDYLCMMSIVEITRSISAVQSFKTVVDIRAKRHRSSTIVTRVVKQNSMSSFGIHISVHLLMPLLQTAQQDLRSR